MQNARRAHKIRLCGHLRRYKKIVKKTYIIYEKYFIENAVRYHHIMDPSTGYPAESGVTGVTVVCDSGLEADALSTACFVLGVEKGTQLLKAYGADGLFVDEDHHVYLTEGMKERFSLLADSYSVEDIAE